MKCPICGTTLEEVENDKESMFCSDCDETFYTDDIEEEDEDISEDEWLDPILSDDDVDDEDDDFKEDNDPRTRID